MDLVESNAKCGLYYDSEEESKPVEVEKTLEFAKVDLSTEMGKQKFIQMIEGKKMNVKHKVTSSVESDLNEIFDIFENKTKQEVEELRQGGIPKIFNIKAKFLCHKSPNSKFYVFSALRSMLKF